MSDVEALLTRGDHERGCEGRTYTCTCGYDERMETALRTLSEQLAEAREVIAKIADVTERASLPITYQVNEIARAFLAKTEASDAEWII